MERNLGTNRYHELSTRIATPIRDISSAQGREKKNSEIWINDSLFAHKATSRSDLARYLLEG